LCFVAVRLVDKIGGGGVLPCGVVESVGPNCSVCMIFVKKGSLRVNFSGDFPPQVLFHSVQHLHKIAQFQLNLNEND
jgi:hypothetical protein